MLTAASGLMMRLIGMLVGLATMPLLLEALGKQRFGVWATLGTVSAWATLFDFGLGNGLLNRLARANGRDDAEEAARSFSTAFVTLGVIALVLGGVLAAIAGLPDWPSLLATGGAVDALTLQRSVVAVLGLFLVGLPLSCVPQAYSAYQLGYVANVLAVGGQLTSLALVFVAVRSGADLPLLLVAAGAGPLAAQALGLAAGARLLPWAWPRLRFWSAAALRALAARSVPLFLYQLGALAVNETQILVLAHRRGLDEVADYALLMRLYLVLASCILLGTSSFVPAFREAHERGDGDWTRRAFRRFLLLRLSLAAAGAAAMLVGGNTALHLWLGRPDLSFDRTVWGALGVLLCAATVTSAPAELLAVMDRIWVLVAAVALNGTVTVALTWWLSARLGIVGAVVSGCAVPLLVLSWLLPLLARPVLRPSPAPERA